MLTLVDLYKLLQEIKRVCNITIVPSATTIRGVLCILEKKRVNIFEQLSLLHKKAEKPFLYQRQMFKNKQPKKSKL